MLKVVTAAALISVLFALPSEASANVYRIPGTVTSVDGDAKTFAGRWKSGERTYKVTGKTAFWIGQHKAAFADLKVGETIQVWAHVADLDLIADRVVIKPQ